MISELSLTTTINTILGSNFRVQKSVIEKIVKQLNDASVAQDVELSSYGYLMYVLEHVGLQGLYRNGLAYGNLMSGYAETARKYKEDMPLHLVNASKYVGSVFNQLVDPDLCMSRLEGMSFPYVLYVLFAGAGQVDLVQKYRPEIEEQLRRYPGTLDLLPAKYKAVGEEVLNANIE